MYKSPIDIIHKDLQVKTEDMVAHAVQATGIKIDKEGLIKALAQDKKRYEEAYENGYNAALDKIIPLLVANPNVGACDIIPDDWCAENPCFRSEAVCWRRFLKNENKGVDSHKKSGKL